mmetsp:Transcript_31229/g.99599  ORF Transcript_31229/g.99599 Transcript_31229/m.99599 type:complete len:268 (+) Transcript_31229:653-1456(+)
MDWKMSTPWQNMRILAMSVSDLLIGSSCSSLPHSAVLCSLPGSTRPPTGAASASRTAWKAARSKDTSSATLEETTVVCLRWRREGKSTTLSPNTSSAPAIVTRRPYACTASSYALFATSYLARLATKSLASTCVSRSIAFLKVEDRARVGPLRGPSPEGGCGRGEAGAPPLIRSRADRAAALREPSPRSMELSLVSRSWLNLDDLSLEVPGALLSRTKTSTAPLMTSIIASPGSPCRYSTCPRPFLTKVTCLHSSSTTARLKCAKKV